MRKQKNFKLSQKTIKLLEALAELEGVSRTKVLEDLVLKESIKKGLEE